MGSAIDQIIDVQISLQAQSVPQPGFGVPLILGSSNRFSERIRFYAQASEMLDDGFQVSDPEYIHAVEATEQALVPSQFAIGKRVAAVAQVSTVVISQVVNSFAYTVTINDVVSTYTSDNTATGSEIQAGLIAAINTSAIPGITASAGSGTDVLITGDAYGTVFTQSVSAHLSISTTTPPVNVASDIAAIQDVDDTWYGLITTSKVKEEILNAAAYIETQKKIYVAASSDSAVKSSSSTTDVGYILKGKAYNRTALMWSGTASDGPDAAWVGGQLPQVPGASTWMFKSLVGITPDKFTSSERNTLIGQPQVPTPGKNVNIYEVVGGVPITREGIMASGRFIDITIGVDWFEATAQVNIYTQLVNNPKIPYTDLGGAVIENAIRQTIEQGITNGLIDGKSPYSVSVPPVLSISQNNRAARILDGVKFEFRLAGAFHHIKIRGTATV